MKSRLAKYFWDLNDSALRETAKILKNPQHLKFKERLITLLSRCDKPVVLFSILPRQTFLAVWPKVRNYWQRSVKTSDFRAWWETIYEQMLQKQSRKKIKPAGGQPTTLLKIGHMLKKARTQRGLSQNDLALKVGMKQPDISTIEEGKKNITLGTLTLLCKALEIKDIRL